MQITKRFIKKYKGHYYTIIFLDNGVKCVLNSPDYTYDESKNALKSTYNFNLPTLSYYGGAYRFGANSIMYMVGTKRHEVASLIDKGIIK